MYASMKNKVQLIGNLGGDPELKDLGNGKHLLRLNLATNERYKGADGEMKDNTEWHTVVAWNKQAQLLAGMVRKGSPLMIEGRLVHRRYETKEGDKRTSSEVVLSDFQLLEKKSAVADM
jgi:single-strand DNA-binding protein